VRPARDHGLRALPLDQVDDTVRVIAPVSDDGLARAAFEELLGGPVITCLARRDQDLDREAARLDDRMDFRARPAARAADRLAAEGLLCARAMELSVM
jgi:hypothetical protein